MGRRYISPEELLARWRRDPVYVAAYAELEPEFAFLLRKLAAERRRPAGWAPRPRRLPGAPRPRRRR